MGQCTANCFESGEIHLRNFLIIQLNSRRAAKKNNTQSCLGGSSEGGRHGRRSGAAQRPARAEVAGNAERVRTARRSLLSGRVPLARLFWTGYRSDPEHR